MEFKVFGKRNRTVHTALNISGKQEQNPIRQRSYGTYMRIYGNPDFKNYEEAFRAFNLKIKEAGRKEIYENRPLRHTPNHMIRRKRLKLKGFKTDEYQRKLAIERAIGRKDCDDIRNVYYEQLPTILNALNSYQDFLDKNHNGTESFVVTTPRPLFPGTASNY